MRHHPCLCLREKFEITDDDTAGVTISETSLEIDEGASDTYEVALDTEPAGNVTVTIEDATGTDLTPDPASLTFTNAELDRASNGDRHGGAGPRRR